MPSCNLNGHHEQLVEHEDSVAHSDHLAAVHFGEDLRQALDHTALVDGDKDPDEEGAVGEGAAFCEFLVEFGVEVGKVLVDVFVKDKREDGESGVDGGIADEKPVLDRC